MSDSFDPFELELPSLQKRLDGELFWDDLSRKIYATDASVYQETPLAVATPKSDQDIQQLIEFADRTGVGLIPRTAGTSLAGQVVGSGIVVDVSRHLNQVIEVNPEEQWVRVQPGVIRNELNQLLLPHGLMFAPETSTANRAMIGGMVGNNSCGANSIVYGSTREHTLAITGYFSDGTKSTLQRIDREEFDRICKDSTDSLQVRIYRGIREMVSDSDAMEEVVREFPKPEIHRRNTGYALDMLYRNSFFCGENGNETGFDFCQLIAGSEGTLFFSTEIKLNLVPIPPPEVGLLCCHFSSLDDSLRATQIVMNREVTACELIDHFVIEGALRNLEQRENADFVEGQPAAVLVVEVRQDSANDIHSLLTSIRDELVESNLGYAYPILVGNEDVRKVWELRRAGLGIVGNVPGDAKPCAVIEDTAVSIDDLPEYIAEFNEIMKSKHGRECVHYAHAGAGEIHLRPILNLKTSEGNSKFREIAQDIAQLVKKYSGSLSGEHGDGRLRAEFLRQMIGPRNYQRMTEIKRLWDPKGILNPGKIIDAPAMNSSLRFQPDQSTQELPTHFSFENEMGMLRAAELCNGSGDCRKTHLTGGTMCPSYMATRDEKDTTRARANLLRQVMTDPVDPSQPLNNEEIKEVMELCLSCKACKRECPSNVDMAKLKAEFLQAYYDANGIPIRERQIANFAANMKRVSRFSRIANAMTSNRWTGNIIKRLAGIATERSLPRLASQPLRKWYESHTPHHHAGQEGKVFLFCDEFTNYLDTHIGIAAIELLERLGFEVVIPDHRESGRSVISKGMLRQSKQIAEENVRRLSGLVDDSTPLIGIEPSAILTFRDEYPLLVDSKLQESANRLAGNCLLIEEFFDGLIREGRVGEREFVDTHQVIRLHGHCHQKALSSLATTVRMLQLPKNYSVRTIPSGCCGMAGSFGFEAEHYEVSMAIGELVLFPVVRAEATENSIAAPGTSCRHQILDGTGRHAKHPVEILRNALTNE